MCSDIEEEIKTEKRLGDKMHSFKGNKGTQFFHDGDFSGNIEIVVKDEDIDSNVIGGHKLVKVNSSDIIELVAEYVRSKKVDMIEQAETEEVLLGKVA